MTAERLQPAFVTGYERLTAWAELLDAINVYPVADADTGRNLVISLAPLHRVGPDPGCRSPPAARFRDRQLREHRRSVFAGFIAGDPATDMHAAVRAGRDRAVAAVGRPHARHDADRARRTAAVLRTFLVPTAGRVPRPL